MATDNSTSPESLNPDARKSMRKVAMTALAGTSIEWYDFFLYGTAAALIFPGAFFPADLPPMVALIASFSTFAVGFIARPLGGIIFGHFGDWVGRKRTLVVALMMMGIGTTLWLRATLWRHLHRRHRRRCYKSSSTARIRTLRSLGTGICLMNEPSCSLATTHFSPLGTMMETWTKCAFTTLCSPTSKSSTCFNFRRRLLM